MDRRDSLSRDPELRTPSLLEQRLQVVRDNGELRVDQPSMGADALTAWRPLVEAAAKSHQADAGGRRRRTSGSKRKRRLWSWALILILLCAAAAAASPFWLPYRPF